MTTTNRTIEQVLQLRLRAAELRVLERSSALLKAQEAIEQAFVVGDREREQMANAVEAKQLADENLAAVRHEIDAYGRGESTDYDPDTAFGARRYAAVLMFDHPELAAADALAQARQDEHTRFLAYCPEVDEQDEDED